MNYKNNDAYCKAFGKQLKKLRLEKGFSMRGLAIEAEMEYKQYWNIEKGEINTTICSVYALSVALDIPVKEFFNFKF